MDLGGGCFWPKVLCRRQRIRKRTPRESLPRENRLSFGSELSDSESISPSGPPRPASNGYGRCPGPACAGIIHAAGCTPFARKSCLRRNEEMGFVQAKSPHVGSRSLPTAKGHGRVGRKNGCRPGAGMEDEIRARPPRRRPRPGMVRVLKDDAE